MSAGEGFLLTKSTRAGRPPPQANRGFSSARFARRVDFPKDSAFAARSNRILPPARFARRVGPRNLFYLISRASLGADQLSETFRVGYSKKLSFELLRPGLALSRSLI